VFCVVVVVVVVFKLLVFVRTKKSNGDRIHQLTHCFHCFLLIFTVSFFIRE